MRLSIAFMVWWYRCTFLPLLESTKKAPAVVKASVNFREGGAISIKEMTVWKEHASLTLIVSKAGHMKKD